MDRRQKWRVLEEENQGAAFSPLSLSPAFWLKTDAGLFQDTGGTTPAVSNGDPIGLRQDQSGNSRHFSQSNTTLKPVLTLSAIGGQAAITPDGTEDYLTNASGFGALAAFTAVFVFRTTHTLPFSEELFFLNGRQIGIGINGAGVIYYENNNPLFNETTGWVAIDTNYILMIVKNGTSVKGYVNGVNKKDLNTGAASINSSTSMILYKDTGSNCGGHQEAETLFFTSALSTANLNAIGGYLGTRFGITWNTIP
jgi:hypothetical protein